MNILIGVKLFCVKNLGVVIKKKINFFFFVDGKLFLEVVLKIIEVCIEFLKWIFLEKLVILRN